MDRNQTLDTAKAAVNRAPKSYGNPREHFDRVARHWNSHLINKKLFIHPDDPLRLKPEDVAIMLGLVKIARLEHDPQHADSWCDLAGYAACGAEVSEPAVDYKITIDTTPLPYWAPTAGTFGWMEAEQQTAWRKTCESFAAKLEPAWKRAEVGDRIRIRAGAKSYAGVLLPKEIVVGRTCTLAGWRCEGHAVGEWRSIRDEDVLEILPPLPKSKFGFTVGETVNMKVSGLGVNPGQVLGFGDDTIDVQWPPCISRLPHKGIAPSSLRHGA